MFVPRYPEEELREVVARSTSLSDVLRHFGLRTAGGNFRQLRRWLETWDISTEHFTLEWTMPPRTRTSLEAILVERSTYSRGHLKARLYSEGLKQQRVRTVRAGRILRGKRIALILDHVNGVANDNRLENLRIVCPNCAATFDTQCGRQNRRLDEQSDCLHCGRPFRVKHRGQRYCSRRCGTHAPKRGDRLSTRRVERPPYEQLVAEVAATGWSAVGRKYGVSDNAVRKWVRNYERALSAGARARRG